MKIIATRVGTLLAALLAVSAILLGCTSDSAENVIRNTDIIVEGYYAHPDSGSRLVATTSGNPVTGLSLRQTGDQLEAFDNNGMRFGGTIGQVIEGTRASFNIEGRSTSGDPATISGNIDVEGTTATMNATWIEPSLVSPVYGQATVPVNPEPPSSTNETGEVRLNQTLVSLGPNGTTTFSAVGGTEAYTWRVSNSSIGNITSISGAGNSSSTYAANGIGENQVIVTDSAGSSAVATVRQTSSGGSTSPVTLNQSLVTVDAFGGTATFTASGGEGTFSWVVSESNLGRITSISGSRNSTATYTSSTLGDNLLTVSDELGGFANAVIIQAEGDIVFPPIP